MNVASNFALPATKAGFAFLCEAIPLSPCEDALASVRVRSLLSARDGVYEAVDAVKMARTFIGLHNDVAFALGAPFAAFACFRAADSGGDFLLADGRAVLAELSPEVLSTLCARRLRLRVARLDAPPLRLVPPPLRPPIAHAARAVLGAAVPLDLDVRWSGGEDGDSDGVALEIYEPAKPPVNRHPLTGEPTFFSGIHSQSHHLQARRAADGFDGLGASDVFYGDDFSPIAPHTLEHIEEVVSAETVRVAMREGDVVLLDSYQALHGRDVFDGPREHGVLWLREPEGSTQRGESAPQASGSGDSPRGSASRAAAVDYK